MNENSLVDERASSPSFCNSWSRVAFQEHSGKSDHFAACGVFKLGVGTSSSYVFVIRGSSKRFLIYKFLGFSYQLICLLLHLPIMMWPFIIILLVLFSVSHSLCLIFLCHALCESVYAIPFCCSFHGGHQYLYGTKNLGIFSRPSNLSLTAICDADWIGDTSDCRSTTSFVALLYSTPISWSRKK